MVREGAEGAEAERDRGDDGGVFKKRDLARLKVILGSREPDRAAEN
jgi:hypothetical protein